MEAVIALLYLAIWIATPLIAHRKGRRWWLWAILGFFFQPIMLIVVALLGPGRRCPHCREHVQRDASVCPHCRQSLGTSEAVLAA